MLPTLRPGNPSFGSGPTAKRPGWSLAALEGALLGRSHRASAPKARLAEVIERSRALLGIPADYRIGILPGSDTGAFECAMWSLLGARGVDVLAFESFGDGWLIDIEKAAASSPKRGRMIAPYGALPDLSAVDPDRDMVFCWNGTTSGVRIPDGDWISDRSRGADLVRRHLGRVCHEAAVGQARCRDLVLAEGAGRRGAARHAGAVAARGRAAGEPSPGLADAQAVPPDQGRQADRGHLQGRDHQHALDAGGRGRARRAALGRSDRRAAGAWSSAASAASPRSASWVEREQLGRLPGQAAARSVRRPRSASASSIHAFTALDDGRQQAFVKDMAGLLAEQRVAYDIQSYRDAPRGPADLVRRHGRDRATSRRCCPGSTGPSPRPGAGSADRAAAR